MKSQQRNKGNGILCLPAGTWFHSLLILKISQKKNNVRYCFRILNRPIRVAVSTGARRGHGRGDKSALHESTPAHKRCRCTGYTPAVLGSLSEKRRDSLRPPTERAAAESPHAQRHGTLCRIFAPVCVWTIVIHPRPRPPSRSFLTAPAWRSFGGECCSERVPTGEELPACLIVVFFEHRSRERRAPHTQGTALYPLENRECESSAPFAAHPPRRTRCPPAYFPTLSAP